MLVTLMFACTAVEDSYSEQHTAVGIQTLNADIGDGDLRYGSRAGDFDVAWTSSGWGRDEDIAADRQEGNSWEIANDGRTLSLYSRSTSGGSVDFQVEGPSDLFTTLRLDGGDARLDGLAGYQMVVADDIYAYDMVGGGEYIADTVTLESRPNPGDSLLIEARTVVLDLPPGRYDLAVWAEPESILEIEDFGFHHTATGEGTFAGISGDGAVRVDVYATGNVTIRQGW